MTQWSMKVADEKAASILNAPASQSTLEDIQAAMEWNNMRSAANNGQKELSDESRALREEILRDKMDPMTSVPEQTEMTMLKTPVNGIIGFSSNGVTKEQKKQPKFFRRPRPVENPNPFEASLLEHENITNRWIALAYQGIAPTNKNMKAYRGTPLTGHAAMMARGVKRPSMAGMLNVVHYGGRQGAEFMNTALQNGGEAFLRSLSIKAGRKPSNTVESIDRDIPYGTSKGWVFVNSLGAIKSEDRFNAVMLHLRGLIAGYLATPEKGAQKFFTL